VRAKGAGWDEVARKSGVDPKIIRQWRMKQTEEWNAAVRRAEAEIVTEAMGEAISALRNQLRCGKPEEIREAAKQLLGFLVQLLRVVQHPDGEDSATFDAFLEGIVHDYPLPKSAGRPRAETRPPGAA
jgi:transposase-like protein